MSRLLDGDPAKDALRKWYTLDLNSVSPRYVLENLPHPNDPQYWQDFKIMLPAMVGVPFDKENHYEGLLVSRSVTEWEVRSAFQHNEHRDVRSSFLWSRRQFTAPPSSADDPYRLYNDTVGNASKEADMAQLLGDMEKAFPADTVQLFQIFHPHYLSRNTLEAEQLEPYLRSFETFVRQRLYASFNAVVELKQQWAAHGCGMKIDGDTLAEMLHHSQWAYTKCFTFHGREQLVHDEILAKLLASNTTMNERSESERTRAFSSIDLCIVGASGAGKTALMAKVSAEMFNARDRNSMEDVPVIIRFCGSSAGSRDAWSVVKSICSQVELLFKLPHPPITANHSYKGLIAYFHSLLEQHPLILFIDRYFRVFVFFPELL